MNGQLRDHIANARSTFDSLPGIVDALQKLPGVLRSMPAAPVVVGAVTRIAADAIAGELRRRGPSAQLVAVCRAHGLDEAAAGELFDAVVDDVRA